MTMEKKIKIGLIGLFVLILVIVLVSNWFISKDKSKDEFIIGGFCSYDKFRGECRITSIFNENVISFRFIPIEPLNLENVGWIEKEEDNFYEFE